MTCMCRPSPTATRYRVNGTSFRIHAGRSGAGSFSTRGDYRFTSAEGSPPSDTAAGTDADTDAATGADTGAATGAATALLIRRLLHRRTARDGQHSDWAGGQPYRCIKRRPSGTRSRARPSRAVLRGLGRVTQLLAPTLTLPLTSAYGGARRDAMRGWGDVANDNPHACSHPGLAVSAEGRLAWLPLPVALLHRRCSPLPQDEDPNRRDECRRHDENRPELMPRPCRHRMLVDPVGDANAE